MTDILQRCLLLAALLILPPPASQAAISSVSQSLHPEHGKRYLPRAAIHVPRISSGEKGQLLPPAAALLRQLRGGSNAEDQDLPSSGGEDVRGDEGSDDRSSSAVGDVPDNAPASCPGTASEKAGKASGCDGCPNQKACASGEGAPEDPDAEAIGTRMGSIKYKVPEPHSDTAPPPARFCLSLPLSRPPDPTHGRVLPTALLPNSPSPR